jgi:hypothetical protein
MSSGLRRIGNLFGGLREFAAARSNPRDPSNDECTKNRIGDNPLQTSLSHSNSRRLESAERLTHLNPPSKAGLRVWANLPLTPGAGRLGS